MTGPRVNKLKIESWYILLKWFFLSAGDWGDKETRERIEFIAAEGKQATTEQIRASLPQSDGRIYVGGDAPAGALTLLQLDSTKPQALTKLYNHDQKDGKLTLLNFGSITWPPFRACITKVEDIAAAYKKYLSLHHIYIVEAHPADGWIDAENTADGVCFQQPQSVEARFKNAKAFASRCGV